MHHASSDRESSDRRSADPAAADPATPHLHTERASPYPLVFAHRGSSAALPEHTLQAYLRAIDEGADGLECDVRLTRDGHLVCIHDRRLDRTSDGRGKVSTATLDELAELDFGSWYGGPDGANRAGVLTLDRLVTATLEAERPLHLLIETKHPNRYRGAVEQRLVDLLRRHGLAGPDGSVRVTVMSFSPFAVRRMRALAPHVATVFLFEMLTPGIRDGRTPFGAQMLGPSVAALRANPELVSRAHARGNRVYVWTVNTPDQVDLALRLGVDGIITNDPAYVVSRIRA